MNDLGNKGYLVFGLILFVWELLPTTLLVGFFRVHRPPQDLVRASGEGQHWRSLGRVLGVWEASGGGRRKHQWWLPSLEHQPHPQRAGLWLPFLLLRPGTLRG